MKTRRKFIQLSALGSAAIFTNTSLAGNPDPFFKHNKAV
ncbi:MAG: twin-arginine translocation signal domain-containing protein [Flavobacteriaceae bacterium]|nr:twin-arginine translocation signal domain-containing protein [Flavobacteriaceae bacterium]